MLGGLILRSHPTKLLHALCNSLVGGVEASQWQLLVQELLYINNGTANQRAKNTPSKSAALHEVARECCRVIDTNIMVDVPGDKPQSNSHHNSQQKSHLVLATPLQWIHCLSPFPYYGSWMDPNRMRIDLSQVGGKPRPKRHRPIQTPVPAFLRCTQRAAAQVARRARLRFTPTPNQWLKVARPVPARGAYRDRHERGTGCGGRESVGAPRGRRAGSQRTCERF